MLIRSRSNMLIWSHRSNNKVKVTEVKGQTIPYYRPVTPHWHLGTPLAPWILVPISAATSECVATVAPKLMT